VVSAGADWSRSDHATMISSEIKLRVRMFPTQADENYFTSVVANATARF
jgi:hypothetical protein